MHDNAIIQQFIARRAQGWSYARIATELNVSKPTLIAWSEKYRHRIQNLKAIELEALGEQWLASVTDRINGLGQQLRQVEAELVNRPVTDLSTSQLHTLARSLRREIETAATSTHFTLLASDFLTEELYPEE